MAEEQSLQGWIPQINDDLDLARVIDLAFDYRGNTTILKADDTSVVGYISNRDANAPKPYIEYFDETGNGPFMMAYSEIVSIKFTGKDTAAGKSWEAWGKQKEKEKAEKEARAMGNPSSPC